MSDERKIRFEDEELGTIPFEKLFRMAERGEIDETAEFWSEKKKVWRPLREMLVDMYPSRIPQMKSAGIRKVKILVSEDSCPVCKSLATATYSIDKAPVLPPTGCTCFPWCKTIHIALE
jgi:hypothetical protein